MSVPANASLFRWVTLGLGGTFCQIGLWARIVGNLPYALWFGLMTLAFAELALWQHRRWKRRQGLDRNSGLSAPESLKKQRD
ncbi:MAG: hypothetical protein ACREX8_10485 [Gammaproteobacteria bacterium]